MVPRQQMKKKPNIPELQVGMKLSILFCWLDALSSVLFNSILRS